jgi:hypoxanthine phosphoribosyltransferase
VPVQLEFMAVSSYGSSTSSSGVVRILMDLDRDIAGRDVLIVEDIIDSGLTLSWLLGNLRSRNPASLSVCTLLRKPDAVKVDVPVRYVGFDIPNEFVVGYGLDYGERYRNLPFIGTLAPEVYRGNALSPRRTAIRAGPIAETASVSGTRSGGGGEHMPLQVALMYRQGIIMVRIRSAQSTGTGTGTGGAAGGRRDVRLVRRERPRAEGVAHNGIEAFFPRTATARAPCGAGHNHHVGLGQLWKRPQAGGHRESRPAD